MQRSFDNKAALIWLTLLGGPCYLVYKKLLSEFGSLEAVFDAAVSGKKPESIRQYASAYAGFGDPKLLEEALAIKNTALEEGMKITVFEDPAYPERLSNLPSACPLVLYHYGDLGSESEEKSVAIVGSRHCSVSGELNSRQYAFDLAKSGVTVVSGMARGCDGAAHRGALNAGGRTVAVLAGGADFIYPPEHKRLYNEIISKGGCVLSESPPGTVPLKQLFPARNRIIAGLSDATVVIEAAAKSGALITADRALEVDRLVFAVPGDVRNPMAFGTNDLIRQGAICALNSSAIIEELGIAVKDNIRQKPRNGWAIGLPYPLNAVANAIIHGAENADSIAAATQMEISEVSGALTMLELRGLIVQTGYGSYTPNEAD